ncbi:unnamed protein product [Cylicocyclus nassatus]|uniref:Uncharacterized protein n=1 Tax=Cylicocyclus nassatus TaxID=53992 RepID=A0AA36M837_CYLNA|nr:unnamed protein product [Cylicocyclus nassatus]
MYLSVQLRRLLGELNSVCNNTRILQMSNVGSLEKSNKFTAALRNYLEFDNYNPFEYCPLSAVDNQGNTVGLKCLKTPAEKLDLKMLDRMQGAQCSNDGDAQERKKRSASTTNNC